MLLWLLFHLFSLIKTEITLVFGRISSPENEWWACFSLAFVLLFLWMHYSAARPSALAPPRRIQSFCTFSSLPPRFWLFLCVSLVQRHVWRIWIVLKVLLLVWLELLVSLNGPRVRHQVVWRLVSWVQLGNMKAPNHPISVSVDKEKNLSFC